MENNKLEYAIIYLDDKRSYITRKLNSDRISDPLDVPLPPFPLSLKENQILVLKIISGNIKDITLELDNEESDISFEYVDIIASDTDKFSIFYSAISSAFDSHMVKQ